MESHFCELSCLLYPLIMWWQFSLDECAESHHCKSKHCGNVSLKCLKCLDNQPEIISQKFSFKLNCHNSLGLINQILMQAGDIEANPGPGNAFHDKNVITSSSVVLTSTMLVVCPFFIDLSLKDLNDVMKSIFDARNEWEYLGLALGLDSHELDSIKSESNKVKDCFKEMLKKWLRKTNPSPSWKELVIALKSETVDRSDLAKSLARDHHVELDELSGRAN